MNKPLLSELKRLAASRAWMLGLMAASVFASGCAAEKVELTNKALVSPAELNAAKLQDDFAFPSRPPRLSRGQKVFEQNCAVCHKGALSYNTIKDVRPIDEYLVLTRGTDGHPRFPKLTRDERWEAIFYYRYLAGGADIKTPEIAALFGSNCAVCHGSKGFADGSLHSGHASAHELGMAPVKGAFYPPPANFHSYSRMYNRTDDILVKHIAEGIYPSAMPSFLGRYDKAKDITFNEAVIRDLVKYVRQFSYEQDLPAGGKAPTASGKGAKELSVLPEETADNVETARP